MQSLLKIILLLFCTLSGLNYNIAKPLVVQEESIAKKTLSSSTNELKPQKFNRFQKWKAKIIQKKIKKMQSTKEGKKPVDLVSLLGFIAGIATLLFIIPESLRFIFLILGPITLALGIIGLFRINSKPETYSKSSKAFAIIATVIGGLASLFFLILRLTLFNV